MPLESISPGSPADWLRFAEADLRLAAADIPDVMLSLFCFHAQQAAEKAIKAVLTHAGIDVQRTHDIRNLLDRFSTLLVCNRFVGNSLGKIWCSIMDFDHPRLTTHNSLLTSNVLPLSL
jgi:hypothetical protein